MVKKQSPALRRSIGAAFEKITGSAVAKAAAGNQIPVLVRPDKGKAVLLVPDKDERLHAFEVHPRRGKRLPRAPFHTADLIRNADFKLKRISTGMLSIRGQEIPIRDGCVTGSGPAPVMNVLMWGEMPPPKKR